MGVPVSGIAAIWTGNDPAGASGTVPCGTLLSPESIQIEKPLTETAPRPPCLNVLAEQGWMLSPGKLYPAY